MFPIQTGLHTFLEWLVDEALYKQTIDINKHVLNSITMNFFTLLIYYSLRTKCCHDYKKWYYILFRIFSINGCYDSLYHRYVMILCLHFINNPSTDTTDYCKSVPITINVGRSNAEVYSIQHCVIKFVSDLRQVGGFLLVLRFPPQIKN